VSASRGAGHARAAGEAREAGAPLVAVLAGGRGRRLGGAKPGALLGGRPLIAYPLAAARAAGLEVVVVAKASTPLPPLEVDVWIEPDLPQHPLAGVVFALERAGRDVIAVAADLPFVTAAALLALDAEGGPHPLFARYSPGRLPALRAALADEAPAFSVHVDRDAGIDPALLFNVNSPEDLAAASDRLGH
jgi:molybdopterin-guanine dinucleotide biosynthesis protein A